MKNNYIYNIMQNARAWILIIFASLLSLSVSAQTITINSLDPAAPPYYIYNNLNVNYTASGLITGTVFYLISDENGNGYLDTGDVIYDTSTDPTDIMSAFIETAGTEDYLIVAGDAGTVGDMNGTNTISGGNLVGAGVSGTDEGDYPFSFDLATTVRNANTPVINLSSANYFTLVVNVDATAVSVNNALVVQYSSDGVNYFSLTDSQNNSTFSGTNGDLVFAIDQSLNLTTMRFRISQTNGASLAVGVESWALNGIKILDFTENFLPVSSQLAGNITVSGSTFTVDTPPVAGTKYPFDMDTYTYNAQGYPTGTTFIAYLGTLSDDNVLATSTVRAANQNLTFNWPNLDGNYSLNFAGFAGDVYAEEVLDVDYSTLSKAGFVDNTNLEMTRAGSRYVKSIDYDMSSAVRTRLEIKLTDVSTIVDHPVQAQYSTDGGVSYTALVNTDGDTDLYGFGSNTTYWFDLPNAAKTSATRFQIIQTGSNAISLSQGQETWTIIDAAISITIGEEYTSIGSTSSNNYTIQKPTLNITDVVDDGDLAITDGYSGDVITVKATMLNYDLSTLSFVIVLDDGDIEYELLSQTILPATIDNTTENIEITGTVPSSISYDNMTLRLYAYDGADSGPEYGISWFADFTIGGTVDDFTNVGGVETGNGLSFTGISDRSVTSEAFNIQSSTDGSLIFELARVHDLVSPTGTDLIIEYTNDGSTFSSLGTVGINELVYEDNGLTSIEYLGTDWPAGVVSSSTQFRVRQEAHNGADLDAWYLISIKLNSNTNLISEDVIIRTSRAFEVLRPALTLDPLDITPSNLAYPMTAFSMTFSIDDGTFPANTAATLLLSRTGNAETDVVLGTIADITTEQIDFVVPPLEAGDYTLYLATYNDENYSGVDLPIYNVTLDVTDVSYSDPVMIAGENYGSPGSAMTVTYDMTGDPGTGTELMLSVFDKNLDVDNNEGDEDYVMIGATSTLDGSITATLPLDIDYTPAKFKLSIGTGIFSNNPFQVELVNESFSNSTLPENLIESVEGVSDFVYKDVMTSSGLRSMTTLPFDVSYGGSVQFNVYTTSFTSSFDVTLQYSVNGSDWEELEVVTFGALNQIITVNETLPNSSWSDQTQFRWIYNEDMAFDFEENAVLFYIAIIKSTEFMETSGVTQSFNILIPSLNINEYSDTDFAFDESVTLNYNAQGFDAATEFAAVIEQNNEYFVAGTSNVHGAASISATMPLSVLDVGDPNAAYTLTIVPFTPSAAGGDYLQSETMTVDQEEDFVTIDGSNSAGFNLFVFDQLGERMLVTRSFDLSITESASLNFTYQQNFSVDVNTNKLTIPRLQASTDGVTYTEIAVYELEDGEEQIYDDGLLYLNQAYGVDIPSAFLTATTQFRWIQPLNLGTGKQTWQVQTISISLNASNAIADYLFTTTANNPVAIALGAPDLDDYSWVPTDLNDAIFNGESFQYTWDVLTGVDARAFPTGTEFVFTIPETDPATSENIVIATTTTLGDNTASVPSFLTNGTYKVFLDARIDIDGEMVSIYSTPQEVASIDVFLKVIETVYLGEENATIYAGSTLMFSAQAGNDTSNNEDLEALTANLIVNYDNKDWLLATQDGIVNDMSVDLPPFMRGTLNFKIELTEGGPIGVVGTVLEENPIGELENDADNFVSGNVVVNNYVDFENSTGRALMTTRAFEVGELDDSNRIEFDLSFDKLPGDLTTDQYIVFEYSIDGGATYTSLQSFPEVDADVILSNERFGYDVPADMIANATILRWRQEERKGYTKIQNVGFTFAKTLPFDYVETSLTINEQALLVTSFDLDEACQDADITLNYEIRGRFGADNIVQVRGKREDNGSTDIFDGFDFNLVEGSGTLMINFPEDILTENDHNKRIKFRLEADDETNPDYNYSINGPYSENSIEVIAPIDSDEGFSFSNPYLCESEDVIVTISAPQNYFMYEIRNVADASILGSLTYDPEVGDNEINIGLISNLMDLELNVTSMSSSGVSCVSQVSSTDATIEPRPVLKMYRRSENSTSQLILVEPGESTTMCEGATGIVRLSVNRLYASGLGGNETSGVEWFRDDVFTSVSSGSILGDNEALIPGDYFARITEGGSCIYETERYTIDNVVSPDRPVVTIMNGAATSFCEGEGEVTLEAPTGFAFYRWNGNTTLNTQSLTVENAGSYYVQVSNAPFTLGCSSDSSVPVVVETYDLPDFNVQYNSIKLADQPTIMACDAIRVYFYDDNSNSVSNGSIAVNKDGALFVTTQNTYFDIDESGDYEFIWSSNILDNSCTASSSTVTVTITESPQDKPVITTTDALEFCEGGSATLMADAGFTYYRWYRSGSYINSNAQTIIADIAGNYTVEVSNVPFSNNCVSPTSDALSLTVYSDPDMYMLSNNSTASMQEGEVVEVCSTDGYQLWAYNTGGNPVTWYRDGTAIDGSGNNSGSTTRSYYSPTQSGSYRAEVTIGGLDASVQCTFSTVNVQINYTDQLAAVAISETGNGVFCEGEVDVLLTAPSGAALYKWYRANVGNTSFSAITGGSGSANTLQVTGEGKYYVTVADAEGCESDPSNVILIESQALANPNITVNTFDADCTTGDVTVRVYGSANTIYQLINVETGENLGNPVVGSSSDPVYVTLSGITQSVGMMVNASWADGTGCDQTSSGSQGTATPDAVILELDGNLLQAIISGSSIEYTWYRNDVKLRNVNNQYLRITDGATYRIEVMFNGGCMATSNAVSGLPAPDPADAGGRIQATAYPNPVQNEINIDIEGENFGVYEVSVVSVLGQTLIQQSLDKQDEDFTQSISIDHLQRGVYNVYITKGDLSRNFRIVKY